jgi:hypothetical protein
MVLGLTLATTQFGDLNLYVGSPAVNLFATIDPTGQASYPVNIPSTTSLCGALLVSQGFVFGDTTSMSTTTLPVTHTRGGLSVVGAY